jgi:excisionase family DNA binding protein
MDEPYLTVTEVARLLNVSRSYVYNAIKRRRLRAIDLSGPDSRNATWRIEPSALAEFVGKAPALGADGRALLSVVPEVAA